MSTCQTWRLGYSACGLESQECLHLRRVSGLNVSCGGFGRKTEGKKQREIREKKQRNKEESRTSQMKA
jgi:hypothetical protein